MITITDHEKNEWLRTAAAAREAGHLTIAARYETAGAMPALSRIPEGDFDALQKPYRDWLNFNEFSATFQHDGRTWTAVFKGSALVCAFLPDGTEVFTGDMVGDMGEAMKAAAEACRK